MTAIEPMLVMLSLAEPLLGLAGVDPIKTPQIGSDEHAGRAAARHRRAGRRWPRRCSSSPKDWERQVPERRTTFLGAGLALPAAGRSDGQASRLSRAEQRVEESI